MGHPFEEAFGECPWRKAADGSLGIRDIVCARSEVRTSAGSDTIVITAADIFPGPALKEHLS